MHRLAEKTGAEAYVLPVPFFANSMSDRQVLLAQPGVREIFDMSNGASLKLVGIGTADADAQLVATGMIESREIGEINAAGGMGEMLGHFFDQNGHVLETTLTARTLAVDIDGPEDSKIVAVAGGVEKAAAIRAVLRSGRLKGLITDEPTARILTREPR